MPQEGTDLTRQNIVSCAREACETTMFQNYYQRLPSGGVVDLLEGGRLSCAVFVSRILIGFWVHGKPLCREPHATVKSLFVDLLECGWYDIPVATRRPGSIIVWEKVRGNDHIGIGITARRVVSNCRERRVPMIHPWGTETDCKTPRLITHILWHDALNNG